ncbi:hypothetical protein MmiAt1_13480 [Methanimicrococcus sp. At1]|uniref:Uncharacterized protein n=1 Tax=Methanimicrococcus hacksteinii TaxID=3028293 RepID=A0ABU3VQR0_9EURY|nr:hypothetical protein [Methanimicrococcus sp. At1]MDV0445753.1 hypothetical protein [Methanimicrococcus sp. At1]
MTIKNITMVLFAFIILGATVIPAYADAETEKQIGPGEWRIGFDMIDSTPLMNPSLMDEFRNHENTLAVYGEIPEISGKAAHEHWTAVSQVAKAISKDSIMQEYENRDFAIGIGAYIDGYVMIEISEGKEGEFTSEDIASFKETADKHAETFGIQNLPLIFQTKETPYGFEKSENEISKKTISDYFPKITRLFKII